MERLSDIVKCLICGYEQSGTTVLSELIRHHPAVDGRFEIGFLLFENLKEYQESVYREFLEFHWEVDREGESYIYEASSIRETYERLIESSSIDKSIPYIYDKTPRYMLQLKSILGRVDLRTIVNVRDPRALYFSMKERCSELTLEDFFFHYESYAQGFFEAMEIYPERIYLIRHEDLCMHPLVKGKQIFDFLGLDFNPSFLRLENKWKHHTNVRGSLGTDRMLRFRRQLSESEQFQILERLHVFRDWFFPDEISNQFL